MRWYRRLLSISYKDHVTNEEVCNRIQSAIGVHDDLLTMVKKRKRKWYGLISRSSGMAKTILQGQCKEQEGEEDRRNRKITSRNGREWGLEILWGQRKTGKDGKIPRGTPTTSKVKGLRWDDSHFWCPIISFWFVLKIFFFETLGAGGGNVYSRGVLGRVGRVTVNTAIYNPRKLCLW